MTKKAPTPMNERTVTDDENAARDSGLRSAEALAATAKVKGTLPDNDEDRRVWDQGRFARLNGVDRLDAPYSDEDKHLKLWQKGFDSVGD